MLQSEPHKKWHCPSPVPSPRAAKAILVQKARGEGQGEGTCSILCNVRVNAFPRSNEAILQSPDRWQRERECGRRPTGGRNRDELILAVRVAGLVVRLDRRAPCRHVPRA